MDIIKEAKNVFNIEIEALEKTREALDDSFEKILLKIVNCTGKVILTGMGKSGHIESSPSNRAFQSVWSRYRWSFKRRFRY